MPRNSAETTCTTSPEQIEAMKSEGYSGSMCSALNHHTGLLCVEVPSAPYNVRLESCSARVVQLEWQHRRVDDSASARQLQFVIEYNTSFDPRTLDPRVQHVLRPTHTRPTSTTRPSTRTLGT